MAAVQPVVLILKLFKRGYSFAFKNSPYIIKAKDPSTFIFPTVHRTQVQ